MQKSQSILLQLIIFPIFLVVFFLVNASIATSVSAQGVTIDLATSSNYNIRYDGAVSDGVVGRTLASGDFDGDGKTDLVIGSPSTDYNSRADSGSIYIIYNTLLDDNSSLGSTWDLSSPSSYNVRYDGAEASANLGFAVAAGDVDGDGKDDLAFMSFSSAPKIYLVYGSLIASYTGTGNTVDLASSSSFNIAYQECSSCLLNYSGLALADLDNDNKKDLIYGAPAKTSSGSSYGAVVVIYNTLIDDYSGTGNNVNMAFTSNFNLRFFAEGIGDELGKGNLTVGDLDNDGKNDLVVAASQADRNSRSGSGSVYVIYNTILDDYTGTANSLNLSSATYNVRFDGPVAGSTSFDGLGGRMGALADVDNDNKLDIIVGTSATDYNSRTNSGSLYVIYNSLLGTYSGTGNTADLANTAKFNVRIDGAVANDLVGEGVIVAGNIDNNGPSDLVIGSRLSDYNSRSSSGSVYAVNNTLLENYSGTGNTVDLADVTKFVYRLDGSTAGDQLGDSRLVLADFNADGKNDLIVPAANANLNNITSSGSVYVIYNFPHTPSANSFSQHDDRTPGMSGNITVSSLATTSLSGVQFSIDSTSDWQTCTLIGNSNYSCQVSSELSLSTHTAYIRAYDGNTSYTASSNYASFAFTIVPPPAGSTSNPNLISGYAQPISVGPNRVGSIGEGGVLSLTGSVSNPGIGGIIPSQATSIDLYIKPVEKSPEMLTTAAVPFPWAQGLNIYSRIYDFSAVSAFNGYPVLRTDNPYTIVLSFDSEKLLGRLPESLRIAYYDKKLGRWRQLPGPWVVNRNNQTIATSTRELSLFAVVYPALRGGTSVLGANSQDNGLLKSEQESKTNVKDVSLVQPPKESKVTKGASKLKSCFLWWCW